VTHPPTETLVTAVEPIVEVSASSAVTGPERDELPRELDEANVQIEFKKRALRLLSIPKREARAVKANRRSSR